MTAAERDDLRNLQDRFLKLPMIVSFAKKHGDDQYLFEPGSPSVSQVREQLHPTYGHLFALYVIEHNAGRN